MQAIPRKLHLVGSLRFDDEIDASITAIAGGSLAFDPVDTQEIPEARH
ncbi:hypothetical protein P1P68_37140 [Streptomyces scabiei]|nr:hypothetical protein [Streptomyces scabiei]MDW8810278.1 hypothetical protein [Streptomyces scabiei]